ncbi:EamA family transporter [Sphingobacterium chungjuense]|uniref:EamA family transporter n=1 Tax=Sphingobacterium chungjuense TaxID=2675553 RepID=UPI00140A8742|nr:EamA family transporter [Sphingobacterium chungjuense]
MNLKYYISALTGFAIWGLFSLVLRPLHEYAALEILLYRVLFATITIWLVNLLFRRKQTKSAMQEIAQLESSEKRKIFTNFIVSALMLSLNWFVFIYVMNAVSVNATSLAYLLCPILTTVLATSFLGERLKIGQWLAVGVSALSCILLSLGHFMDLFYSLMIALTYAIYLILQKSNTRIDKLFSLSIHFVLSTIILLPLFGVVGLGGNKSALFYELVLLIAVVFTIIPLFLNAYALKGLNSSLVGILLYINPLLAFTLAVTYFKEPITGVQVVAYGMIFLAVLWFNFLYFQKPKKVTPPEEEMPIVPQ